MKLYISGILLILGNAVFTLTPAAANPTTAREVLAEVDSAARSVADDAQLLLISGWQIDTTGRGQDWIYVYESASLEERFEIPVADGEVRQENTVDWLNPDQLPIPEEWINSDAAVAEAEENGGKGIRETYDDVKIEMRFESEWVNATEIQPVWHIRYISPAGGESFYYRVIAGPTMPLGQS